MAVFHLCLLTLLVAYTKGSYVFSNSIVAAGGDYNVSYNFNASADTLEFLVEVRATGWVGFGFALTAPNNMTNYDVAVGGVLSNGSGYLADYYTNGFAMPPLDAQQDWNLVDSSEQNGVTTLKFYRQRNTSDANDVAIEQGMPIFLILAYHASTDVDPSSGQFPRHTYRSFQSVTLIPSASSTVSTVSASSSSPATVMAPRTTSTLATATTPTMPAMTASALEAINTFTTLSIAPTATTANPTPVATSSMVPPTMQAQPNFVSFGNDGNYNVSWTFNSSTNTLHFMVTVRTTGWIAFGVTNRAPNNMLGYDVAVGGVLSGSGYLRDYFTDGQRQPPEDTQQDWMLSYSREENGVTTLKFYRRLNTSEANDVIIQQGMPIFLVWAYHSTNDVQSSSFGGVHSSRGWLSNVVLVPGATPTTGVTESAVPTTVAVMPPGFTRGFDNNRYVLSWRFDDQADMMYYHLRVKTTGWVGFGFAEKAPNMMIDYDVVVAGFSNGRGYLYDYKTTGQRLPSLDDSQDYTLKNASEAGGYTELWFERPRDTVDGNDIAFLPGVGVHFIWAYGTDDITDERNFGRHAMRGWSSDQVVQVAADQPVPTPPSGASSPCSIIYLIVTLSIAVLTVLIGL